MARPPEHYDDIAPTAFLAAYWRRHSDTPYAAELYGSAVDVWHAEGRTPPDIDPRHTHHGPTMELRQRAGDTLLGQVGASQIIDLAAGLSPRGLQQTEAHPAVRYVEVDLPIMEQIKRRTLRCIGAAALDVRHFLVAGSALDPPAIEQATTHLERGPVTFFSEGFLHYLNYDERAQFADTITGVLKQRGGYLITDLPHHPSAEQARRAPSFSRAGTQRDVAALAFDDQAKAIQFFAEHDLTEETRLPYTDLVEGLVSPAKLGLSLDQVKQQQQPWGMHVFRVSDHARA